MNKVLLAGYAHDDDGPCIVLDDVVNGVTQRSTVRVRDRALTLSRYKARYCVGRYDLRTFQTSPCPLRAPVSAETTTCLDCLRANGFNPGFYRMPVDKLSPQQREYNEQSHIVYLAHFGDHVLKVGISHRDRALVRLKEQGARLATFVKLFPSAYGARGLEEQVNRELRLPESLRGETKRALLNKQFDIEEAAAELRRARSAIGARLGVETEEKEIIDLMPAYIGRGRLDPALTDVSESAPLRISGRGVGIIGDVLVTEQAGRQFMVSLKKFIAHVVAISDLEEQNAVQPAPVQRTLFGEVVGSIGKMTNG
jgi:hypothetical protein